jgi:hypothetical protein
MTNLHLRVLAGILLSLVWVTANLAFAQASSPPPSVLARAAIVTTTTLAPPEPTIPTRVIQRATSIHTAPVSTTTQPHPASTPIDEPAEHSVPPAIPTPTPNHHPPIGTNPLPHFFEPEIDIIKQKYGYYDKGSHIVALQEELGMGQVDGIYGPNTRRTHIEALGGPTAAVYTFYPEIGQTPTPCSHGCPPGDGHYELPTLGELINEYFLPEDRALARKIAFCESSGQTHHIGSTEVSSALAVGWFQHLAKYWVERSERAGWKDYDPFNGRANVAVAAWLYYTSGVHHWNPSRACWGEASL